MFTAAMALESERSGTVYDDILKEFEETLDNIKICYERAENVIRFPTGYSLDPTMIQKFFVDRIGDYKNAILRQTDQLNVLLDDYLRLSGGILPPPE